MTSTRERDVEIGALAVGALWLFSRLFVSASSSSSSATSGPTIGVWPQADIVPTGNIPAAQFDQDHFAAITSALVAHNAPASVRTMIARAWLAHMISETGRTAEKNYNPANLRPNANWSGPVYRTSEGLWRAYPTLQGGVDDYANSITGSRYGGALGQLAAGTIDEAEWYRQVRAAGWTAAPATDAELATFRTVLARLRAEFPG